MKLKVYTPAGETKETVTCSDKIFSLSLNPKLLSQVVKKELANWRQPIAHTKDRSEVQGGGRKPFRQKGTGSARAGSTRSPIWIGGGVVFGPRKTRNFQKRVPRRMSQQALRMALSLKAKANQLIVVTKFDFGQIKTKAVQSFFEKLPIKEGRILIFLAKTNVNLELSTANLAYVKTVHVSGLNLRDLLNYDYLVTDKEGLKALEKLLAGKEA